MMQLEEFFERAWSDYLETTPSAKKIKELFESRGEKVVNDHIALRTFDHPSVNMDWMAKYFLELGYSECGQYQFPEKKLSAKHFEHPSFPKVFISQLEAQHFPEKLQSFIKDNMVEKEFIDLFFSKRPWDLSYAQYNEFAQISEYAAWVAAWGFRPNHFTVSINDLKNFDSVASVNELLKKEGFRLNSSGGEVKGSREVYLEQSSIMADVGPCYFSGELQDVPSCYYEFAFRYPTENGELYNGFVAKSADKIFESTGSSQ